jgi:hypothetical protein
VKDLKTILWGKSVGYADLREKKEFVAKIMSIVKRDLKRMQKKELKKALEHKDVSYNPKTKYEHEDLINLFLES